MSCQCYVSCLLGKVHQICHEFTVEKDGWEIGFLNIELLLLDGRDDGLGQRLGVLLLDTGFDVGTVHLLGGRVVLFVLVKYDRVGWSICKSPS